MRTPVVFSWSAGKDSAFGLWTLLRDPGSEVRALLTTLTESYDRVSMSGVREALLDLQAEAMGLPVIKVWIPPQCSNEVYENRMASTFASDEFHDVDHVAFADLLEDIRAYREMIASGFRAIVVCVDPRVLDRSFAGRAFDEGLLADLPEGVDPCGENGEFHTFVHDGPLFRAPIPCRVGEIVTRDGFLYRDVVPRVAPSPRNGAGEGATLEISPSRQIGQESAPLSPGSAPYRFDNRPDDERSRADPCEEAASRSALTREPCCPTTHTWNTTTIARKHP